MDRVHRIVPGSHHAQLVRWEREWFRESGPGRAGPHPGLVPRTGVGRCSMQNGAHAQSGSMILCFHHHHKC